LGWFYVLPKDNRTLRFKKQLQALRTLQQYFVSCCPHWWPTESFY